MKLGSASWQKEEDRRKGFSTACTLILPSMSRISEQSRDIQEVISLISHCKTMYCYRTTSPITSTTSRTLTTCTHHHPGWIDSRKRIVSKGTRQSVFFTAVNPMYAHQDLEEVQYDLENPRIAVYKITLEYSPTYSIVVQSETCSVKRIAVPSNTIPRNTLLAIWY